MMIYWQVKLGRFHRNAAAFVTGYVDRSIKNIVLQCIFISDISISVSFKNRDKSRVRYGIIHRSSDNRILIPFMVYPR